MPGSSYPPLNFDPATALGAVFWGVVAGIVTSAILLIAGLVFTRIFIPWLEALRFHGVDLSGVWTYQQTLGDVRYDYVMNLKQSAHRIMGTMNLTKMCPPGSATKGYVQGFELSGSSWEGFVVVNMRSVDRRSLAFATSLLHIKHRGQCLLGYIAYRSTGADEVHSETISWTRV